MVALAERISDSKRRKLRRRTFVYHRDGWACVACGTGENLTIDHKRPRSKGGTHALNNQQVLCESCNQGKADWYHVL